MYNVEREKPKQYMTEESRGCHLKVDFDSRIEHKIDLLSLFRIFNMPVTSNESKHSY